MHQIISLLRQDTETFHAQLNQFINSEFLIRFDPARGKPKKVSIDSEFGANRFSDRIRMSEIHISATNATTQNTHS